MSIKTTGQIEINKKNRVVSCGLGIHVGPNKMLCIVLCPIRHVHDIVITTLDL